GGRACELALAPVIELGIGWSVGLSRACRLGSLRSGHVLRRLGCGRFGTGAEMLLEGGNDFGGLGSADDVFGIPVRGFANPAGLVLNPCIKRGGVPGNHIEPVRMLGFELFGFGPDVGLDLLDLGLGAARLALVELFDPAVQSIQHLLQGLGDVGILFRDPFDGGAGIDRRLAAGFLLPGGLRQFLDAALISGDTSVIGADALLQFRLGGLDGLLFGFQGLVGVLQLRRGRRPWIGLLALLRAFLRRRRGILSGVLAGLLVARFIAALLV